VIEIQDTLYINVEYSTEDEDYGPVYIATCGLLGLTTDGRTLDELIENLHEAIVVSLEGVDTISELGLTPNPKVVISLEMPTDYAKTA
jgi:predicted RNase H-like HicB family nuclease